MIKKNQNQYSNININEELPIYEREKQAIMDKHELLEEIKQIYKLKENAIIEAD